MNATTYAALLGFVATFSAAGLGLLAAMQGTPRIRHLARDLGLAYMLGLAALGSLLTLEVIAGIPLSLASIFVSGGVLAAGGFMTGRRRGRREPAGSSSQGQVELILTGALVVVTIIVLEAVFRAARLQGLYHWDAGSFWIPKAEAIYYTGGLDEEHFRTLPAPSYPPLQPVLHATFFHFLGSVQVIPLHLLHWTLLVGFVGAAARLLAPLTQPFLLWAAVLMVVVARGVGIVPPGPDVVMDCLLGLGVLCVVTWLADREPRLFPATLVFVSAAALMKREGLLLAVCIAGGAAVASIGRLRLVWPRIVLLAVVPLLATVPWRIWFTHRGLAGDDGPEVGLLGLLDHLGRLWPATTLVLGTLPDPAPWRSIVTVALAALAAALLAGERRLSIYTLALLVLSTLGFVWVMWSFPSLPLTKVGALNPIPRLVGSVLIPVGLIAPILLHEAMARLGFAPRRSPSPRLRTAVTAGVIVAALGYPAAVLAIDGMPRFPSSAECARLASPVEDGNFLAVYAHRHSLADAVAVRDDLLRQGFVGAEARPDGCGSWEVANPSVVTVEQAQGHAEDARRAGYTLRLERP